MAKYIPFSEETSQQLFFQIDAQRRTETDEIELLRLIHAMLFDAKSNYYALIKAFAQRRTVCTYK